MVKIQREHWCQNCGKLLFKSGADFTGHIEIMCKSRDCKTMNVFCGSPEDYHRQIRQAFSSNRLMIKEQYKQRTTR